MGWWTLGEVRDGLGDPRGGPGRIGRPSERSGTGRVTLPVFRDGYGDPPGGFKQVGRSSRRSEMGRKVL